MFPILNHNDEITCTTNVCSFELNDIVVFYKSENLDSLLVKQIYAMPGDNITLVNSFLIINGTFLHVPLLNKYQIACWEEWLQTYNYTVPTDNYLLISNSDIKGYGIDSRQLGFIPKSRIIAKVIRANND